MNRIFYRSPSGEVFEFQSEQAAVEFAPTGSVRMSPEEVHVHLNPPVQPALVDQERDRRIAAGFTHAGKTYDSNPDAMRRIDKAYAVACRALVEGAKVGNLRWADATQDFRWIAKDNSYVTMDAPTVVTFGEAAAAWETKHIYRARELKSMSLIPTDYTADKYWS